MLSFSSVISRQLSSYAVRHLDKVDQMFDAWKYHLPYIKPFYAVKASVDKEIVGRLSGKDIGFEVASKFEIKLVKDNAYDPDMIYGQPFKSIDDLKYAKASNVRVLVVDCIEEIKKIQSLNYPAKLLIRLKADDSMSIGKMAEKFGCNEEIAGSIVRHLEKNNLELEGFCFHNGSAWKEPKLVSDMIRKIIDLSNNIKLDLKKINTIDIGGGMSYLEQLVQLDKELKTVLPVLEKNDIRIVAEPGRLIAQESMDLVSKVIGVSKEDDTYYITIDDTTRSSFCIASYFNQHTPVPLYTHSTRGKCIIRGRCPDHSDIISVLPDFPVPAINDSIRFKNMGAYNVPYTLGIFNGFQKCLIVDSSQEVVKKTRQSYRSIGVHQPPKILSALDFWKQNLPRVAPFFNLSAFPSLNLIKFLAQQNIGLSVSYMKELKMAEKVVKNSNWMFSSVVKTEREIHLAKKKGLKILTVDCVEEVDKIAKIYPSSEILVGFLSKKEEIIERIEEKGLKFLGLSFSKGENIVERVREGLTRLFRIDLDHYYIDKIKMINLGGHFERREEVIEMKKVLEEFKGYIEKKKIKLIAEPGSLLCRESLDVYCKVIAIKRVEFQGRIVHNIIVNDGLLHSFAPADFRKITHFEVTPMFESSEVGQCVIYGPSGAGEDRISDELTLPIPQLGDVYVVQNVGGWTNKYMENSVRTHYIA